MKRTEHIRINRDGEIIHILIGDESSPRFDESLVAPAPEDMLFYVTAIARELSLPHPTIHVSGATNDDTSLLKRYYTVTCE